MVHSYVDGIRRLRLWRLRHNTARPDVVGADQPQPVDALTVAHSV